LYEIPHNKILRGHGMGKKIRFGIYGAGNIARLFCETAKNVDNMEIKAVCAANYDQAKNLAKDFGIQTVYEHNGGLAEASDIDAIYVGTLHTAHYGNAMMALKGGKHVLCEKAFVMNAHEAEELISVAHEKKLMLMEAMWSRFHPVHDKVMSVIANGEIGEVTAVVAMSGVKTKPGDRYGRVFDPKTGGGALLDFGCYAINQVLDVLGENYKKITTTTHVGGYGVDEIDTLLFHYENGKQGVAMCSCSSSLFGGNFIYGTEGYIRKFGFTGAELVKGFEPPVDISLPFPEGYTGYEYEVRHFINCINQGSVESDVMPHSTSLAAMRAIDEAYGVIRKQEKHIEPEKQI
jgi:predicted dehydrogenase